MQTLSATRMTLVALKIAIFLLGVSLESTKESAVPRSIVVFLGDKFKLDCAAHRPENILYFAQNGSLNYSQYESICLPESNNGTCMCLVAYGSIQNRSNYKCKVIVNSNGSITIDSVQMECAGLYICKESFITIRLENATDVNILNPTPRCSFISSGQSYENDSVSSSQLSLNCTFSFAGNTRSPISWTSSDEDKGNCRDIEVDDIECDIELGTPFNRSGDKINQMTQPLEHTVVVFTYNTSDSELICIWEKIENGGTSTIAIKNEKSKVYIFHLKNSSEAIGILRCFWSWPTDEDGPSSGFSDGDSGAYWNIVIGILVGIVSMTTIVFILHIKFGFCSTKTKQPDVIQDTECETDVGSAAAFPVYTEVNKRNREGALSTTVVTHPRIPIYTEVNKTNKNRSNENDGPMFSVFDTSELESEATSATSGPVYSEVKKTKKNTMAPIYTFVKKFKKTDDHQDPHSPSSPSLTGAAAADVNGKSTPKKPIVGKLDGVIYEQLCQDPTTKGDRAPPARSRRPPPPVVSEYAFIDHTLTAPPMPPVLPSRKQRQVRRDHDDDDVN